MSVKRWTIAVLAMGVLMTACKKERPVLDPPQSKLEGINHQWKLIGVDQVDAASIEQATLDVSEAFINGDGLEITFNSTDFSYSVDAKNSPNYLGAGGSWEFDDNDFPSLIALMPTGGEAIVLPLLATVRPKDPYLKFGIDRRCGTESKPYVGYQFTFMRIN